MSRTRREAERGMKTRIFVLVSAPVAAVALGYAFLVSLALTFLVSRHVSGETAGKRGRFRSVILPLGRWQLHLHHWLYSTSLLALSLATGVHFLSPAVTYGLLGGMAFQGLYQYNDWHVIVMSRKPAPEGVSPLAPPDADPTTVLDNTETPA